MENGLLCGFRECRIEIGQNLIGTFFGLQCAKVRFFSYICTHIHYFLFANERPHTDFGRYTPPYKALDEDTVETFFRVCSSHRGIPDLCFCTAGTARHFRQRHGFVRCRRYFGPACSPVYRCPCAGAGVMYLGRCFRLQSSPQSMQHLEGFRAEGLHLPAKKSAWCGVVRAFVAVVGCAFAAIPHPDAQCITGKQEQRAPRCDAHSLMAIRRHIHGFCSRCCFADGNRNLHKGMLPQSLQKQQGRNSC